MNGNTREGPRIQITKNRKMRGLSPKEVLQLQKAASGEDRYKVRQDFRELVELKSRFIPKIWDGLS